jgi:hypothetical protein
VSKARARAMIAANTHILEALRDALLDRDELIGEEITAVCEAAGPAVREGLEIERRGRTVAAGTGSPTPTRRCPGPASGARAARVAGAAAIGPAAAAD